MALSYDAGAYLLAAGKPYHLLEFKFASGGVARPKADLVAEVVANQNADGSWPAGLIAGKPGSVSFTARLVELLARAGAEGAPGKGATWLATMQRPDGGFSENPALADALKPEWEWFSTVNAVTWITGDVILALVVAGAPAATINKARNLLVRARNRDGGWPGQVSPNYPDRTDLWTIPGVVKGLLAAGVAANHDVFAGLADALRRQKDGWRNPVENPLAALLALGRRTSDAEVQACLKLLAETQNPDGGWPYLAGGESHPDITTAYVALLARYRLEAPA